MPAPQRLYKFFSDARTSFFDSPQFLFRHPEQFNDFFDCAPQIQGVYRPDYIKSFLMGSIILRAKIPPLSPMHNDSNEFYNTFDAELESKCIDLFKNSQDLAPQIITFIDTPKGQKEFFEIDKYKHLPRIINKINSQLKNQFLAIFCLTENATNKVMWAQYANDNKGFVLEINTENNLFHEIKDKKNSLGCLKKVAYKPISKARFVTDYITPNGDFRYNALLRDAIFTKQTIWSFEKEWRIAFITEGLLPSNNVTRCDAGLLISVPSSIIKGVYLGTRASDEMRDSAIKFCTKHDTPLFQMVPTPDQEFTAEPVIL
ncbi:DUF2971 domain-containing protein [Desulfovibrio sp. UIB00]|uniref:DUF2971 domain-containing protein n=1 Tax=Desulfovibrio sp. UIB00 TaxID=2804314 RepID=UPI001F103E47|nr:DUF2971 domain-containing protein [Desulfovibrio sp. UIB00]MCH5144346.1 DUF2971 domain-containing protein [Desulfovibrio sp. UIB00]